MPGRIYEKSPLARKAREIQARAFHGAEKEAYRDYRILPYGKEPYTYFTPKYFIDNGTIDRDLVTRMRHGAKLLTVGSGPAMLERTLLGFSIPIENIHLADLELHDAVANYSFPKHKFDMTKPWPDLKQKFDFIIFPESISILHMENSLSYTRPSKEDSEIIARILSNNSNVDETKKFIKKTTTSPRQISIFNALKNAINCLTENGEIRVSSHWLHNYQLASVFGSLKLLFPDITIKFIPQHDSRDSERVFVIKRNGVNS